MAVIVRSVEMPTEDEVATENLAMLKAAIAAQRSLGPFTRDQLYRRIKLREQHTVLRRILACGWLVRDSNSTTHNPAMNVTPQGYAAAGVKMFWGIE